MKKIILLFVLFLFFVYLSAREINEIPIVAYSSNSNDYKKKYTIAEIKIKGAENYDYHTLTSISGLSVGDKINIPGDEITSALKAFLRQGFLYGKILATKQTENSVWLEIILQSSPIISNVNFIGIKEDEKEELGTKISIVRGLPLTPNLINQAEKQIKNFFIEKGFYNIKVKIQQKSDVVNKGKAIVNIIVDKNRKVKVRHIHIIGNNVFSDHTLKMIMKNTNEEFSLRKRPMLSLRKLFSPKEFIKEKCNKDVENIILKYNKEGYRDACIVSDSTVFVNDNQVDIYLTINEGSKYYIRNINWVGNVLYSSENLSRMLDIKSGDVYDQKRLNARLLTDEDAVSNLYYDNGYIFSSMNPMEVCVENDSVDVEIRVLEGIQATINRITINGNNRVFEDVIRRELVTKPGQLFNKKALTRSVREIAQMGNFDPESIDVQVIPDSKTGKVDINYNLTSKANDRIEFSAGWEGKGKNDGTKNGIVGRLNLKSSNFSIKNLVHLKKYKGIIPQGEGQTLSLSAQKGLYSQSYNVLFLDPWINGKRPNSLSLNIDYKKEEIKQDTFSSISKMRTFGLSTNYNKRLSWPDSYVSTVFDLSYQCYWPENWQGFHSNFKEKPISYTEAHNLTFGLTLNRNSIDNPTYPRCGSIFSLSAFTTPPYSLLGSNNKEDSKENVWWIEYYKWKFKNRIFVPLINREKIKRMPVLMSSSECGFVGKYNSETNYGTFCMGGDRMPSNYTAYINEFIGLRGYGDGELSKKEGTYYTKLALELRYPLVLEQTPTIYGLMFVEAGNAWDQIPSFKDFFDLKQSAGAGIRILLPMIGLIGVDWAYGFSSKEKGRFHFILGKEF